MCTGPSKSLVEERFRVRVREYSSSFLSFFFFAVGLFLSFFLCFVFFWSYSGPVNFVTDGVPCVLDEENKSG